MVSWNHTKVWYALVTMLRARRSITRTETTFAGTGIVERSDRRNSGPPSAPLLGCNVPDSSLRERIAGCALALRRPARGWESSGTSVGGD
jgi:hypothetical protein